MVQHAFLDRQLKALANRRRREILGLLKKKHFATATAIARALNVSQQAVSRHLNILHAAEIVEYRQRGRYISYRLQLKQTSVVQAVLRSM